MALAPVKSSVANCQRCAAGAEFSAWLCGGALFTAGLPQYGQARDAAPLPRSYFCSRPAA